MDFREAAALLHLASVKSHSFDLGAGTFELTLSGEADHTVRFEGVSILKWTGVRSSASSLEFSIVGLEMLGAGEPWRLYARTREGAELELSCAAVSCDGDEITGIGRSYRH